MRYPRILFYAVNGLGLGHATRLLAIARQVRARAPDAELVFLTSSEAESVLYREGFAAFKAPSRSLRGPARLRPSTYARMLQTVTVNLLASFHPHVLVVDTFPTGALQELLPVLRWDSRKVFVYRVQRPEAARSAALHDALRFYDLAVVPHAEGEVEAPVPDGLQQVWAGPILIRERGEALPRAEAREALGVPPEGPLVYITFGGGGDPDLDRSLTATVDALAGNGPHLAVACAPLQRRRFARRPGVTTVEHYPMAEMLAAYDAAVSACGYNSAMELLHHGVPSAFVPFARQVDDQDQRARWIEGAGAGLRLPSTEPDAVRTAVARLLGPEAEALRQRARDLVPEGGAARAAEAILRLIP
ncbi:MAG TPA: nucleotide disphospho-sugar-binding domain-containing protein [Chthonomonadales bacterium]|nr:nucleotide disphospho-sugar-binding domain-containing protein [Chthonomonadales bacterium]